MQKQFAVTRVLGDREPVLKLFEEDEKEVALAYGAKTAEKNTEGIISCIQAVFDVENHTRSAVCRVFKVWAENSKSDL